LDEVAEEPEALAEVTVKLYVVPGVRPVSCIA